DPRQARQVPAQSQYVVQGHGQRVVNLGSKGEGDRRRGRADDGVTLQEGLREVLGDERTYLLSLLVVGLVVPGRKCVRAQHDSPPRLGSEVAAARPQVGVQKGPGAFVAHAVLDTVEPRQV